MKSYLKSLSWGLWLFIICLATTPTIYAQSESIKSARRDVLLSIDKLTDIKVQGLTPGQKQTKEIEIKKTALEKIFNLSIIETEELKTRIDNLTDIESELIILRDGFDASLDNYLAYFESVKLQLEAASDLESIENIAGGFQTWRAINYDPKIHQLLDFILTFQNKNLLKIADQRFNKISLDIKKIRPTSIKSKNDFNQILLMLNRGAFHLVEARNHNLNAIKMLLERLPNINIDEPAEIDSQALVAKNPSQLSADINEQNKIPQKTIKDLIGGSLNQIREAYKIFFDITAILNKY